MNEIKTFNTISVTGTNLVTKYGDNYVGGSLLSFGDTNFFSNSYIKKNLIVNGLISCDQMFSIKSNCIEFNYNLTGNLDNNVKLGAINNRWKETYTSFLDAVVTKTYDLQVSNNLICGKNNEALPILTINSTDAPINCSTPTDFALLSTVFKIGKTPQVKKSLYINPYNHSSYLNTDSFYLANFTNNQKIIDIDNYMNVNIKTVGLRLSHNTLEYPTITAIGNEFNIGVSTAILSFNTNNIYVPYELKLNYEKSSFVTFYNLKGVPIDIHYGSNTWTLNTKLEFYYDHYADSLMSL